MLALGLNDRLSASAARAVVGQQWGLIPGRQLADNVCEAESAMLSFSAVRFRSVDVVFFYFNNALPSLSRRWMLEPLACLAFLAACCASLRSSTLAASRFGSSRARWWEHSAR